MAKRTLYRAIWVPSVMALAGLIVFFAQQPTAIPTPAPPTTFTTIDKTITVSHPVNWKPLEGSIHAVKTKVKFEPAKNIRVVIETDLAGSLLGDISKASSNMLSNLPGIGQQLAAKQKTPLLIGHLLVRFVLALALASSADPLSMIPQFSLLPSASFVSVVCSFGGWMMSSFFRPLNR